MARIVFRLLSQTGHHNGTFSLAEVLKSHGHTIIYASRNKFKTTIEHNGFEFYEITKTEDIMSANGGIITSTFKIWGKNLWLFFKRRLNYHKHLKKQLETDYFESLILKIKPDLIILDSSLKFWGLQIVPYKIPFITIQTFVSTLSCKPPRDSSYIPDGKPYTPIIIWLTWRLYYLRRISYLSPRHVSKKLAKEVNFPLDEIDFKNQGPFAFKYIPEINTSFYEFDYPHKKYDYHYYFKANDLFKRIDLLTDVAFQEEYPLIQQSGCQTIFCSFGSLSLRYPNHEFLLKKIFNLFCHTFSDKNLILCVEDDRLRYNLRTLNNQPNIFIYKRVPQTQVLMNLADLMIHHGGMNSIFECIQTSTPMLIYPGSIFYDQIGNAARVKFHKIGLQGSAKDSASKIEASIKNLLQNNTFKQNIMDFKDKILRSDQYSDINELIINTINYYDKTAY